MKSDMWCPFGHIRMVFRNRLLRLIPKTKRLRLILKTKILFFPADQKEAAGDCGLSGGQPHPIWGGGHNHAGGPEAVDVPEPSRGQAPRQREPPSTTDIQRAAVLWGTFIVFCFVLNAMLFEAAFLSSLVTPLWNGPCAGPARPKLTPMVLIFWPWSCGLPINSLTVKGAQH